MDEQERAFEPVTITLKDKQERPILFTLGGLKRIRKHPEAASEQGTDRLDVLGFMLHEALRGGGDESITIEEVEDLMDMRRIRYIDQKIQEAMSASNQPPKNEEPAAAANQPATETDADASTSSSSGPSDATISDSQTAKSGD